MGAVPLPEGTKRMQGREGGWVGGSHAVRMNQSNFFGQGTDPGAGRQRGGRFTFGVRSRSIGEVMPIAGQDERSFLRRRELIQYIHRAAT